MSLALVGSIFFTWRYNINGLRYIIRNGDSDGKVSDTTG